eukprot:443484-Pelagomonas_calceolata.AAC.5
MESSRGSEGQWKRMRTFFITHQEGSMSGLFLTGQEDASDGGGKTCLQLFSFWASTSTLLLLRVRDTLAPANAVDCLLDGPFLALLPWSHALSAECTCDWHTGAHGTLGR